MKDLMRLIRFVLRMAKDVPLARTTFLGIVVTGTASGLCMAALIAVINGILADPGASPAWTGAAFAGLLLFRPLLRFVSQVLVVRLTQSSFLALRLNLCRQILATPLRRIESLGPHRLLASLAGDVGQIIQAAVNLPVLLMHLAVLAGCLVYLGWLSWVLLPQLVALMVLGIVTFRLPLRSALRKYTGVRELYDRLFKHFRSLTEGIKELKMHAARRGGFMETVRETAEAHRREARAGDVVLTALSGWGELLFFVALGLLFFVAPRFQAIDQHVLIGYAVTVLMMRGPIEGILNSLPDMSRAMVAVKKVREISRSLADSATEVQVAEGEVLPDRDWQRLELRGVTHAYRRGRTAPTPSARPHRLRLSSPAS